MHPLWAVCILVRLSLICVVRYIFNHKQYKSYIFIPCVVLLLMGLGFVYKGLFGSNNERQIAKVFWHETRIIHGAFYLLASYYLYVGNINMNSSLLLTDLLFSFSFRAINRV